MIIDGSKVKKLFTLRIAEDGTYFATRKKEPAFCFAGTSVEAVSARAYSALKYYEQHMKK